ncbi:MAG: S41 family peptidase [Ruminococcaceae bacterium]|nr:S41 family peptidase [Oscillospiraceae bacterium]
MSKRISVFTAATLLVAVATVTFICTLLFGGGLVYASDNVAVETTVAETTAAPEVKEPSMDEIISAVSKRVTELAYYYSKYYVGTVDIDDIVEGVAEGFVAYSGDKYGQYHTAEEYKELTADYTGEFAGIGVSVTYNADYAAIEIMNVLPNSPALEAGLLPNDLIIAVEGESVGYLGYNEAINRIRGEIGTTVTVAVVRDEDFSKRFDVTLTRRIVEEQSVTYKEIKADFLANPLAYISVTTFNNKTPEQFKNAIGDGVLAKAHGFIIDMRNNGGGTLTSVLQMLDLLLPEGPMVRIQYKNGEETVYKSDAKCVDVPIVVLVNGNTASAAELFTSSLRDYGRAFVVGDVTFGKGTVQTIVPLRGGSALRISTSMYAPPFSDNFEGVGITPDVEVSLADEFKNVNIFNLKYEDDVQLQAAVNMYK